MIDFLKRNTLPLLTLAVGSTGLILRLVLNGTADDKGFVTRWHWSTVFMLVLEILVAYIQAYVFTMLSSVFIGLSLPEHHEAKKQKTK